MKRDIRRWTGHETVDGEKVGYLAAVLRTKGCEWKSRGGGCLMCGYHEDDDASVSPDEVGSQLESVDLKGVGMVKLFASGSLLNAGEVSLASRGRMLERISGAGVKRVVVESRPEYVTDEALAQLAGSGLDWEVAIGLESSDDRVRALCVRKGFSFDDFVQAARRVRSAGGKVRTYLLLKPPYMTERTAMEDLARSISLSMPYSDTVSVNPASVHRGTEIDRLFSAGAYRPPWFWSLFSALGESKGGRVVSYPSGQGTRRGIHNCGACDRVATAALDAFNDTGDPSRLDIECGCRSEWKALLESEGVNGAVAYEERKRDW